MSTEKKSNSPNNNNNDDKPEIINLSSLENKTEIKNSEYILAIMEICINNHKYNLPPSNSTRVFWEEVMENQSLFDVVKAFKAETLRKYWRIIRDLNEHNKVITIVKKYSNQIDNPCYKLLPIINIISDFIQAKEKDFEHYLERANKTKQKKTKEEGNGDKFTFIKNKRKADDSIEELQEKAKEIQIEISLNDDILIDSNNNNNELQPQEEVTTPIDNNEEVSIEEIINTFNTHFPNIKRDEIYQALYKTSGNIKDAYLYLTNPDKYKSLTFVGTDDYIIQNLRNKPYYEQLLASKGIEKVQERELFLKIK